MKVCDHSEEEKRARVLLYLLRLIKLYVIHAQSKSRNNLHAVSESLAESITLTEKRNIPSMSQTTEKVTANLECNYLPLSFFFLRLCFFQIIASRAYFMRHLEISA